MRHRVSRSIVTVLVAWGFAGSAWAGGSPSDLTGTWLGKVSCKATSADDGRNGNATIRNLTLLVRGVQANGNGREYVVDLEGDAYSARSADLGETGSGKGAYAMALCGSSDDVWTGVTELWRMDFKANAAKGTGKLSGELFFNDTSLTREPDEGAIGRCKTSWKRISADEPNAAGCAP